MDSSLPRHGIGRKPAGLVLRAATIAAAVVLVAASASTALATSPSPKVVVAPSAAAVALSSHIVTQIRAQPHAAIVRTTNALAPASLTTSTSGSDGSASASRVASTTASSSGGNIVVHTKGTLTASVACAKTNCPGDVTTNTVYGAADADIFAQIGVTGDVPYRLYGTLAGGGTSISPCANVTVTLGSDTEDEHAAVYGPGTSDDPDCLDAQAVGAPASATLHATGILHATTGVTLSLHADTSFIDPGTKRKESLKAVWDITLVLGPECTISPDTIGSYDPNTGATFEGTSGNDVICGGAGPDIVHGNGGTDRVYGNDGNDFIAAAGVLDGGDGTDTLCGSSASDTELGGDGNDLIAGGPASDSIDGGYGDDIIIADATSGDVSDLLTIGCSGSTPTGASGADVVHGGPGHDSIKGGRSNDTLYGDSGDDLILGGQGNDKIIGGSGMDKIHGDDGNDTITGGTGKDVLAGNAGNDLIYGADGIKETISCGSGSDVAHLDAIDTRSSCEATTNLK
ncbi:MAG: calcium-binding protein [Chloroflexota bacterium]